jgi:hypothetical protein
MHEAHADRPDPVTSPGEDAKDPPSCAFAETEHSPFTDDERVMHDKDFARGQASISASDTPCPRHFGRLPLSQSKPPELHGLDEILFCICKSNAVAST